MSADSAGRSPRMTVDMTAGGPLIVVFYGGDGASRLIETKRQ
jgi:hypothetical protein